MPTLETAQARAATWRQRAPIEYPGPGLCVEIHIGTYDGGYDLREGWRYRPRLKRWDRYTS